MSSVESVAGAPPTPVVGGQRATGRAEAGQRPYAPAPAGEQGQNAAPEFNPFAALVQVAHDAAAPPASGLQAQLLDWAAPTTRQFEAISPARLLPLLGLAVNRLGDEARRGDELDQFGATALERELRDHQALAERRATLIAP